MKTSIRLYSKTIRLFFLFLKGVLIAGALFPAIGFFFSPVKGRYYKDAIKIRWLRNFGRILNLNVIKEGEAAPSPVLIVSNHVSWLDIIALGQFVPGCFAAKSDIERWPVIGYLSRQADTVFIRRGDKKQILQNGEKMAWQLRANGNILVFPEGTTTDGCEVLDFHASLFQPALLTRSSIQPAAIRYLNDARKAAPFIGEDEFVPHLLRMLSMETIDVRIDFLPVIDSDGKTRNTVNVETRNLIKTALDSDTLFCDASISPLNHRKSKKIARPAVN